jgi:cholesterol transport system auxiliary component
VPSEARKRNARFGLVAGIAICVAACSLPAQPVPTYDLIAPRDFGKMRPARGLIEVGVPTALQVLDTEKIVAEPSTGVVTYLSDAQWSDRLPKLLQARMIEAFENSSRIRTVARAGDRVSADAQLVTDIRQFGIEGKEAVVELSVKLIGTRGGRINAAKIFIARVPAPATSGGAAASAINDALNIVLVDLVKWTSTKI